MVAAVLKPSPSPDRPPKESFELRQDYPKPTLPSQEWCLVRVKAAGLNRAELRGRAGLPPANGELSIFREEYHEDPPAILGEELVGVVEEAGTDTGLRRGDVVTAFIYGGGKAHDGAYAQYSICHRKRLYRLPFADEEEVERGIGWKVLAAVPMSMWTAYGSIFEAGRLGCRNKNEQETLLIHGGTSSVGVWAILLAKDKGFTVIATTRQEDKLEQLQKAGADHAVLDQDLEQLVGQAFPRGVDVVLELVGPDMLQRVLPLTARCGSVVCTGVLTKQWDVKGFQPAMIPSCRNLTFYSCDDEELVNVEPVLKYVVRKIKQGAFKPDIFLDKVFALEDIGTAHEHMEDSKAVGKVVVTIP
jgi:NADPH:quinone reductase-like Zn-dependent oxidoreductase